MLKLIIAIQIVALRLKIEFAGRGFEKLGPRFMSP